jgi:hypothetical protein
MKKQFKNNFYLAAQESMSILISSTISESPIYYLLHLSELK